MGVVARSSAAWLSVLKKLLPKGKAWTAAADSDMEKVLHGLADELARVDAAVVNMADEAIPDTTTELLEEWEAVAGLPEDVTVEYGVSQTADERRAVLNAKLANVGNLSASYYAAILAAYGVDATFDTLYTPGLYAGGECNVPCGYLPNAYIVGITIQPTALSHSFIEAVMQAILPAYVHPIYTYV